MWKPTYPLVLPTTILVLGGCASAGAGTGLHALGAARRSLRAMVLGSALAVVLSIGGAVAGGAVGTMAGAAVASWIGALVFWRQFRTALREHNRTAAGAQPTEEHPRGRRPEVARS